MKCPYCHQELIKGHIQTRGEVIKWLPEEKREPILESRWSVADNEIKLGEYGFIKGGDVEAYCCSHCHKIIIDY
ncbi:MAG: PF20097 family protein [Coprobacillus sp.]